MLKKKFAEFAMLGNCFILTIQITTKGTQLQKKKMRTFKLIKNQEEA